MEHHCESFWSTLFLDISALQLAQFETQQKRALIRIFKERIGIATASCQLYLQN